MRKWPIPSDNRFTRLGLIYKTGGEVTEAHYERILNETMEAYYGKGAENNDAIIKERIYIIKPLKKHFWAPFVEGRYDALSLLWRNIARDNVPNNCYYLAVISGITDVMDLWDHREGEKDLVLPYVRLSDALVDEAEGKIKELRERGRDPKVFLAGTASMTDHYSALWDLFERKGAKIMKFSESVPEQQLNNVIVACEQEGRLPNTKEQASIREILADASREVDIIALTCYELESCVDDATKSIITENECKILYGATLHATKLGEIIISLLTT